MNESHRGYTQVLSLPAFDYNTDPLLSHVRRSNSLTTNSFLNPRCSFRFQSFQLGAGHRTRISTRIRSFPMLTKKTSTTLLNASKRAACWPDHGVVCGSSFMSGAGTTSRINLLFFRKTTSAKTRPLKRRSGLFACVDVFDGVSNCMAP